ncbi:TIGR02677 family protein [Bacillus sp. FJAT-49705]|uniref:TIGR02677 family protein n=1 Tax=Cytobacillus citreus TaxID=2833586 RepID=A0ABS5NWU1_9BACI|nr:TIGR02677 family protein [Cytobacillus citreus]MBS4192247.1 TIGR02677 family protein [Cytobacillus citreus]
MNNLILKPISEATYLTVDNAWRYRAILRYFYEQHERMRQFLFPEEIFHFLKKHNAFREYTMDMMQNDLDQLVKWKNIIARQETGRVRTIEEFKKKRFRYQCSPYTVEIERMVRTLENMGGSFGGSLEKTLFDRLYEAIKKIYTLISKKNLGETPLEEIFRNWEDVFDYYKKMVQNSADYIAYVSSENVEEKMQTESFLLYKDSFTEYLRDFIISLQQTSLHIELQLKEINEDAIKLYIEKVVEYQQRIPRLEEIAVTNEEIMTKWIDSWNGMKEWFLGSDGQTSELNQLQEKTNETIRKLTRFAQRLGEKHQNLRSRKKDYLHLAAWFAELDSLEEAHKVSSAVFGVFHTKHIFADEKATEDIYKDIWEKEPTVLTIKPRIRQYREKTKPSALHDHKLEKEMVLNEYLDQKEAEKNQMLQYIQDDKIIFKNLPKIDGTIRKILLQWLAKALSNKDQTTKVEIGNRIKVSKINDEQITLRSTDGDLIMPNFEIQILEGE